MLLQQRTTLTGKLTGISAPHAILGYHRVAAVLGCVRDIAMFLLYIFFPTKSVPRFLPKSPDAAHLSLVSNQVSSNIKLL